MDMINKSRDDIAYNILDVGSEVTDSLRDELRSVPNVVSVRVLGRAKSES